MESANGDPNGESVDTTDASLCVVMTYILSLLFTGTQWSSCLSAASFIPRQLLPSLPVSSDRHQRGSVLHWANQGWNYHPHLQGTTVNDYTPCLWIWMKTSLLMVSNVSLVSLGIDGQRTRQRRTTGGNWAAYASMGRSKSAMTPIRARRWTTSAT